MAGLTAGVPWGWLTRSMAALLRRLAGLVAADRREWAEAVCAEAAEIPAGRPRLAWLAGGLWLVATDSRVVRSIGYSLVFGAAAAGTAWSAWGGAAANPATLINRVEVITVMLLAGLPFVVGPASSSRTTRVIRAAGYAAIFALVLVKAAVERFAYASNTGNAMVLWTGEFIFLVVVAAYVAGILAVTTRRTSAAPATLVIGMAAGVAVGLVIFALGPLGSALSIAGWPAGVYDAALAAGMSLAVVAPIATGWAAARRTARRTARRAPGRGGDLTPAADPARQGAIAGLCGGTSAALVASVLSTGTIALLPRQPALLRWAMAHSHWFTGPAGHGTRTSMRWPGGQQRLRGGVPPLAFRRPVAQLRRLGAVEQRQRHHRRDRTPAAGPPRHIAAHQWPGPACQRYPVNPAGRPAER